MESKVQRLDNLSLVVIDEIYVDDDWSTKGWI